MNLANKLTIFRVILVPIMVIIPLLGIQGEFLGIPIIVLAREFMVSGYRLIAVEKDGKVIAASIWGKLKTVTQMLAIILAFIDLNSFGDCFARTLHGWPLVFNIVVTLMMIVQVIATIFSGASYMKNFKELLKD